MKNYIQSHPEMNLTTYNNLLYSIAVVITNKLVETKPDANNHNKHPIPKWKYRIERQISDLRKEASLIYEFKTNPISARVQRKIQEIKWKYQIEDILKLDESIKQRISAYAQRIRRYEKRNNNYKQNRLFVRNKKKFYRSLGKSNINVQNTPQP